MINKIKTELNKFMDINGYKPDAILISAQSFSRIKSELLTGNHTELSGVDVRQDGYLTGDVVVPVCRNECLSFIDRMFGSK